MQAKRPTLPQPVAQFLSRLPAFPGSWLFVAGLNVALVRHLPADVREALTGKKLRLRVKDAQVAFDFEWRGGRFVACQPAAVPDLAIGACASDFLLLAQRKEDPDTLFFSRRLEIEGDTELGLLFKNTLDAIDMSAFDPSQFSPQRVFAHFRAR